LDDLRTLPAAEPRGPAITLDLDGQPVRAHEGEPVAVALYASGIRLLARSPKYHRPRGLFCGSGHCASCLLRVDGRPNLRACLVPARPGLRCDRQNAFPDPELDLLRAADWLFPKGMDHHELLTGNRLANELFVKVVRQMGGSGTLPDQPPDELPPIRDETLDLCIVGAGPAGLAAARAAAEARPGLKVVVLDDQDRPGGSLLAEPGGCRRAAELAGAAEALGIQLWRSATAIGFFPEDRLDRPAADGPAGVLAVSRADGLVRVSARRFLYTTGAYDQNLPLADCDRPGVLAARAVGRLAFRWGVRPGRRVVIVKPVEHAPAYLERLARGLADLGVPSETCLAGALPRLDLERDVFAMGALPAPASELPRQHGARVRLDLQAGGFCVQTTGPGGPGSCAPGVLVAGDVTGYVGPDRAAEQGAQVGGAAARSL
jgi:sarcosine oxidase, subunit alpha